MPAINKSGYKVSKSGNVRLEGQLPTGDGSTGRGNVARAGTLGSSKGDGGNGVHFKPSFTEGGLGKMAQKFRPKTKGGSVK